MPHLDPLHSLYMQQANLTRGKHYYVFQNLVLLTESNNYMGHFVKSI